MIHPASLPRCGVLRGLCLLALVAAALVGEARDAIRRRS